MDVMHRLVLATVLLLPACTPSGTLEIATVGLDDATWARVATIEVAVVGAAGADDGSVVCDLLASGGIPLGEGVGQAEPGSPGADRSPLFYASFRVAERPPAIGHLPDGRVVFFARARTDACEVVARGCEEVTLGSGKEAKVTVPLEPVTAAEGCGPGTECADARCVACDGCSDGDGDADADGDVDGDADGDLEADADSEGDAEPDAEAPECRDDVCDFWPQCGCPAGEACTPDTGGEPRCSPAGTVGHGRACRYLGDCAAGTLCVSWLPGEPTVCTQYCAADAECAPLGPGAACAQRLVLATGQPLRLCTIDCDPASTTPACPPGVECTVLQNASTLRFYTSCEGSVGSGTEGDPCDGFSDCTSGHACGGTAGETVCTRRCTVGVGSECTPPAHCDSLDPPVVIGVAEYGICGS